MHFLILAPTAYSPLNFVSLAARFLPSTADEKQLALLARALGTAAVLRPELCARQEGDPGHGWRPQLKQMTRLLREDHRAIWIASAESASAETQVEVRRPWQTWGNQLIWRVLEDDQPI